jgi:hypothetical protein
MVFRAPAVAALAFTLFACGPAGPTYHQNIAPLLAARCNNCHVAGGIAPFALGSYDQAKPMVKAMILAVESGRMPPWKAGPADVTYLRNPTLTAEQLATLKTWEQAGAPEGSSSARPTEILAIGGGIERVDLELSMPQAYTPSKSPDDYRCFVLKWPKTEPFYVTGFNAVPGVPQMAHHIALYLVPPDAAALPSQWDAEDATPGYSCFGGPFGDRPQQFAVELINAWIPGYQGVKLPRGRGILVPPGATVVLQMHYNVQQGGAQPDLSKLQFTPEKQVDKRATYQPLLDVAWVAGGMRIPAGQKAVVHQLVSDPREFFKLLGSPLDNSNGFNLEAVMFHMHKLGTVGELYLEKPDKRRIKLLSIPSYDFHWQLEYYFDQPVRFEPGDKLRVRCTFDNSQERTGSATPADVNWGENSDQEMCVANLLSSE